MNEATKEILSDYGYETWNDQEVDTEEKVDPKRVKRSIEIIKELNRKSRAEDCLNYDKMILNKPDFPPGHPKRLTTMRKF
jgi:hypothetical protein